MKRLRENCERQGNLINTISHSQEELQRVSGEYQRAAGESLRQLQTSGAENAAKLSAASDAVRGVGA